MRYEIDKKSEDGLVHYRVTDGGCLIGGFSYQITGHGRFWAKEIRLEVKMRSQANYLCILRFLEYKAMAETGGPVYLEINGKNVLALEELHSCGYYQIDSRYERNAAGEERSILIMRSC